ncbi:MAG: sigma-70 family RNA polymerase sigma factor [Anaerolineales bacterium]
MNEQEARWIAQAQRGSDQAFTELVEMYQNPVYHLCYRMLGNAEEAEDAAQESFLRAYKALRSYDSTRSFATWLLSIASHYCIDQIRKRRMTLISLDTFVGEILPDPEPGPEAALRQNELQQQVRGLLDSLSPLDRAAVVLFYWYDYSYDEIAQTLELSVSAVKSRLHRARLQLASVWEAQQPAAAAQNIPLERKRHESPAF